MHVCMHVESRVPCILTHDFFFSRMVLIYLYIYLFYVPAFALMDDPGFDPFDNIIERAFVQPL